MAIISCPFCRSSISSEAIICPKCKSNVLNIPSFQANEKTGVTSTENSSNQEQVVYRNVYNKEATVGDWMLNILVASIPLIGLIVLIVWAGDTNINRKNWAIAKLIWAGIVLILAIIFWGAIIALVTQRKQYN